MKKIKLLMISDHALTHSGVATQSRHLIEGLINTGKYSITQLGAGIFFEKTKEKNVNKDFKIIPCNGYGNKRILKSIIETEEPDAIVLFTDIRRFKYIFEMSEEIRKKCPIFYWHVWDNRPTPLFNKEIYESLDHIACISKLTYDMCREMKLKNISYVPHTLPKGVFYKLSNETIKNCKEKTLGLHRKDHFVGLWLNRNIKRKRPADVLKSWQMFLFKLEEKFKHKNATLIMHTNPFDVEGVNLVEVAKHLNIQENVCFSDRISSYEQINALHNISDFCLNMSYAEGFGLSTLESMQVGNPIIATSTGGLTNQIINQNNLKHNGILLRPTIRRLTGNQETPYIYEDFVKNEDVSTAILELYEKSPEDKRNLQKQCSEYVENNFCFNEMINKWNNIIQENIKNKNK